MDLESICRTAMQTGASDIHIKSGSPPLIRVDGHIQRIAKAPVLTKEVVSNMAWAIMTPAQRESFKRTPDLDMAYTVPGQGRFRVNVFRQRGRIGLVLRAIPSKVLTIDDLALPKVLKEIASEQRGLVLLTGATGSGKSTTLAAVIEHINQTVPHHILTIEDPVEFTFEDKRSIINQREVGTDSIDFQTALRAALRQDPDVILVGELRDVETMEIALTAAETGHLVLGTLHTINATEAIQRIVGFFEPHHQDQVRRNLAAVLVAVVSQRLVPRKGGGRVAAIEVMRNVGAINECIGDSMRVREIPDLLTLGTAQYGTQSFDQSLYWSYQKGLVELGDLLRFASNPDDLQLRLSGIANDEWNDPG